MGIEEKFQKGAIDHTYQRIDSEYKVNIFLGYTDEGNMSMVITEFGNKTLVKSTKLIEVSLKKREDGKMALSFDLLDNSYKSLFLLFCKDMIVVCERAGSQMAISTALSRWKYWKEMFGKKRSGILEKHEIKGLIGELIELKEHFINEYGESVAVRSWMGPLMGHKDFEIDNTWFEIKTVNENAVLVQISSLEQLDSESDGHLVVIKLEDASSVSDLSINLNEMVLSISDSITDPEALDLFRVRLDNMGYVPNDEYDEICFIYKGKQSYVVKDGFPRLTRRDVPEAIGNVEYSIMLNGISSFKEG